MDYTKENYFVVWKIRCLNRKTKAFYDLWRTLDWKKVPCNERSKILPIIESYPTNPNLLKYQPYFFVIEQDEIKTLSQNANVTKFLLIPGYFEDEQGNQLDEIGVMQIISGKKYPIILDNPNSVLRLGPIGLKEKGKWSQKKSNDIGHFFQIVRHIAESNWISSSLSLKFTGEKGIPKQIISFDCPDSQATSSVLLAIRQLYANDEVFNHACNAYLQHVGDERKKIWVKNSKKKFNKFRDSEIEHPFSIFNFSAKQLLDHFIYGTGSIHRNPKREHQEALEIARGIYGTEYVAMAFNSCCRYLLSYALDVYYIIKQDFDHWVKEGLVILPNAFTMGDFLDKQKMPNKKAT